MEGKKRIIYNVTIKPAEKPDLFHITWFNKEKRTEHTFNRSAAEIYREEVQNQWLQLKHQLPIGKKLFRFLDGDRHYLARALDEAARHGESLVLYLRTCKQTADWPFELLARESFLLPQEMHLVRCVSDWGVEKKHSPQNRPLKLLFMACSPLDVKPELDFEKEEETIFQVTENLAVNMEVDDSGSLEGLGLQLEQEEYDVIHLSGHADIDKNGQPFFVMEDETGQRRDVFPFGLWQEALIENPPRLLFLSGCRTGETPGQEAAVSYARALVENYHVPAVLGWGRPVSDQQATLAENMIYHELSRGKILVEAIQRARYQLTTTSFSSTRNPAWPLLRMFSSGESLSALVTKGQEKPLKPRRMKHIYLKQSRVQVLEEGFVGRRRQLQQSLKTLNQNYDKIGVLLHGTGGLGKSCLAGKICERFKRHHLIIVHGILNTITLETALKDAFINAQDETGEKILAAEAEMTDKLAKLCASSFKDKHYLLLFDDFEQNLEGAEKGQPGRLLPETAQLLYVLLHYLPFSGKRTQLLITSRYRFSLTDQDRDLVSERLELVCLTSFPPAEQQKKARELDHILSYPEQSLVPLLLAAGHGNPRLMEWLDLLVGQMSNSEVPQLLEAVKDKQEEFIRNHVIRELLRRGGKEFSRFLCWLSIYRRPVLKEGVQEVAERAGLTQWQELLRQGLDISLVEHDPARLSYGVTPLLREELLLVIENLQPCHRAAFNYYKKVCESKERFDPLLVEDWIFHALGCGEEDVASRQGGDLVTHLGERLAFRESRRVGEWILEQKKQALSTGHDAFLLNALAYTLDALGEHRKAIDYYEQSLDID